jgi:hypothetical protein
LVLHLTIAALAAGASPTGPIKLAAPGLTAVHVDSPLAEFYSDHLAAQIAALGVRVITQSEVASLLGLERQRRLLACTEASCAAEVANALGVDGLITGSIGRFGDTFQVNVKVIGANDGRQLSVLTLSVDGEKDVVAGLTKGAKQIVDDVRRELRTRQAGEGQGEGGPSVTASAAQPSATRRWWWVPSAAGAALAGAGGVLCILAKSDSDSLNGGSGTPTLSYADALHKHDEGASFQTAGLVLLGVGAASLAAGGAMFALGGAPASTSVAVGPHGAQFVVVGSFP